jgi:hypothetical protein
MQNKSAMSAIFVGALGIAAAVAVAAMAAAPQPAMANPAMAKKTGQPCGKCHTAPPALNAYGKKYKEGAKK